MQELLLGPRSDEPRALRSGPNVTWDVASSCVLKVFGQGSQRELNLEMWLATSPGLVSGVYCSKPDSELGLTVLVTRHIAAVAPTRAHALSLAKGLCKLASRGWVHGDVRAANVLCDADGTAHIIDFDLGGRAGSRAYVPGFNTAVNDEARHPGAIAGEKLRYEHDLFSFLKLSQYWGFVPNALSIQGLLSECTNTWRQASRGLTSSEAPSASERADADTEFAERAQSLWNTIILAFELASAGDLAAEAHAGIAVDAGAAPDKRAGPRERSTSSGPARIHS